jgi:hypothetical protein
MLPALTDKPFNSGENSPRNEDVWQKNPKRNELKTNETSILHKTPMTMGIPRKVYRKEISFIF